MRIPIRKSEQFQKHPDEGGAMPITAEGLRRLKETLRDLEKRQLPQAIDDTSRSAALGDFSENAEYQEAKGRLRRIHARILFIKEKIKRAQVITRDPKTAGRVQLGSTVTVRANGETKTYELVGPQETNPGRGRISHQSPLGAALLGKTIGERVTIRTQNKEVVYEIVTVI